MTNRELIDATKPRRTARRDWVRSVWLTAAMLAAWIATLALLAWFLY